MATTEQQLYSGDRAKEVLENEAFIAAFEAIETEVMEQWKNSPARDKEGRESLWAYLMLLKKVQTHLVTTMETGKLAKLEIAHQQTLFDRAKAGVSSWLE
jgi:hypothetical protein